MGSAIQAGDSAISRCRNRELDTGEPDTAEEGARVLAGPRSGDGPRSVRARPPASSVTRTLRPETRARREPASPGTQAIPCKVQACNQGAISHGNQRSVTVTPGPVKLPGQLRHRA
jgi:hypothetical protein